MVEETEHGVRTIAEETEHRVRTIAEEIIDKIIEAVVSEAYGKEMNLQTHKYQEVRKRVKSVAKIIEDAVAKAHKRVKAAAKIIDDAIAKAEKRVKAAADGVEDES